eukprot:CAMPEP_0183405912 /NCGR_PEP_ID=MMETSP0370-20130417/16185_1 /TAXON_ID=268820 /ORGANISM="Peridinium aciculiferum, Strain PAER-2" /LENGTH=50 /DNA_ID=CAMNT_0025587973 /DNA_START=182 /DNA_END=334 /DNA_ORIENTATION=+
MRPLFIEDDALPPLQQMRQRGGAVQHPLRAPIHALAAAPLRLVGVGFDPH